MGVGIEFDTKNSCRKYQVCKPVAPRKTSIEAILLRFFLYIFFSESFFPLISSKVIISVFITKVARINPGYNMHFFGGLLIISFPFFMQK